MTSPSVVSYNVNPCFNAESYGLNRHDGIIIRMAVRLSNAARTCTRSVVAAGRRKAETPGTPIARNNMRSLHVLEERPGWLCFANGARGKTGSPENIIRAPHIKRTSNTEHD